MENAPETTRPTGDEPEDDRAVWVQTSPEVASQARVKVAAEHARHRSLTMPPPPPDHPENADVLIPRPGRTVRFIRQYAELSWLWLATAPMPAAPRDTPTPAPERPAPSRVRTVARKRRRKGTPPDAAGGLNVA